MNEYPYLAQLVYCIDSGFPAPVTEAMMALVELTSLNRLTAAYDAWCLWGELDVYDFNDAVEEVTEETCFLCDCGRITWEEAATEAEGNLVCNRYCLNNYRYCDSCDGWFTETTTVSYSRYCESCLSEHFTYCEHCDAHFNDEDGHNHDDDEEDQCDCEAPHPHFSFPANGHGSVAHNERLTVELPKGVISEYGILQIKRLLWETVAYDVVNEVIDTVGELWQTKQGNFTTRLSRALFKQGVKLRPGVLSDIGNTARAHSSDNTIWHIEFTRDLNGTAGDFYHEDSCWWTSHFASRCALKNWGGMGLRSYTDLDIEEYYPNGRIWVQPLNKEMQPTHDSFNAHAYVVFNGYGELTGFVAARIVAHLTSKSYRKVSLGSSEQFINNDTGYLVADEATCNATDKVRFYGEEHNLRDANTYHIRVDEFQEAFAL